MPDTSIAQLGVVAGVALAVVFVAAAIAKARDLAGFRAALAGYGWLPGGSLAPLAVAVPSLELTCATLLLVPASRPGGAVLALTLLLAFTVALASAVARGRAVDCGCFGGGGADEPASWLSIVRNSLLAAVAVLAIAFRPADGAVSAAAVLSGAGVGLLIVLADRALAVFRRNWLRPEQVVR